jgi:hypothetical protein
LASYAAGFGSDNILGMDFGDKSPRWNNFFWGTEDDAGARCQSAGGAAGSVYIRRCVSGKMIMDDKVDLGDIKAAGSHVSGY